LNFSATGESSRIKAIAFDKCVFIMRRIRWVDVFVDSFQRKLRRFTRSTSPDQRSRLMLQQIATSNVLSGVFGHVHLLDLPRKAKTP